MELTRKEIKDALDNPANQPRLTAQHLERFNAMQLCVVLEQEIKRCEEKGLSHIALNMNLVDCAALAKFLRRGSILGG